MLRELNGFIKVCQQRSVPVTELGQALSTMHRRLKHLYITEATRFGQNDFPELLALRTPAVRGDQGLVDEGTLFSDEEGHLMLRSGDEEYQLLFPKPRVPGLGCLASGARFSRN
jgi:hypothetical protein